MIKRVYVKKKDGFNIEAKELLADVKENLNIKTLKDMIAQIFQKKHLIKL